MRQERTYRIQIIVIAVAVAWVVPGVAAPARSNAPVFARPIALAEFDGGEPSLAIDPSGNGGVYVVAPQSVSNASSGGVGFWASHDHGRTFPDRSLVGSAIGGGDSDVEVGLDHTVYVADLELAANAICRSSDGGRTFGDAGAGGGACSGIVTSQYALVSDREWLNHGPHGELYLTYHDLHVELPYVLRSDDQGRTFTPCGPDAFSTSGDELKAFTPGPTSGTQVPKPVIGPDGSVSVMFATGDPQGVGFDHLWMSTTPACTPASTFTTHLVFAGAGASLSHPFDGFTMDRGGTMYVIAGGTIAAGQTSQGIWLFRSTDHGATWSPPVRVNTPGLKANMLPAVAGGLRNGEVTVGWYGSSDGTTNAATSNNWRYYVATSFDGGRHFSQTATTGVMHKGAQARALLDFTSIAVEPRSGAVIATFAGDADGTRKAYVVRQTGGAFLR